MVNEIIVPKVGTNAETAVITKWLKNEGDTIRKGDVLFEMVTDKATFSVESEFTGILYKIFFRDGSTAPVARCVAIVVKPGEDTDAINLSSYILKEEKIEEKKVFSTPGAKKLAEERGVSIEVVARSKGVSLVREKDIIDFINSMVSNTKMMEIEALRDNYTKIIPSSVTIMVSTHNMRKKIRLLENKLRITLGELVVYAISRCIRNYDYFNSFYSGNEIKKYSNVNIGIAVSLDEKLFVPVIKNADNKTLEEIAGEIKNFAIKTIKGRLDLDDLKDGTITVTDLSSSGVVAFQPLINKNQAAIIGIASEYKATSENFINLILTFDHRIANGMQAAEFLASIKTYLEGLN